MANVTASAKPREGIDFFPLSVDYEEKLYSVGKIPGSFLKREGRPTDTATLDLPDDRPPDPSAVPQGYAQRRVRCHHRAVGRSSTTRPRSPAMLGASIAIAISDIPCNGPIAAVNVGLVRRQARS